MKLKPLPIGIHTFRDIIKGGYLYVDKTRHIYKMIRYSKGAYFLSRPRRFGKSLLVSTLDEIFQGNRDLFKRLWLYDSPYQWEEHPVIRIDFSEDDVNSAAEMEQSLHWQLQVLARQYQLTLFGETYTQKFRDLIFQLASQKQIVILIDEYDKPILDNIENLEEVKRIREILKGFYTVIKGMDKYVRFVLLTGVSKFSKVGVFSGLNNLNDISLDSRYASLLGITQSELEENFEDRLKIFAAKNNTSQSELLGKIRHWYNGFCFSDDCVPVYNPFSLLLLFDKLIFRNYWFESGTPTFLINLIRKRVYDISLLDDLIVDELAFSSYEVESLNIIPLLYQTGYLSIKAYDSETHFYRLYYPNYEVENAFNRHLLSSFSEVSLDMSGSYLLRLVQALQSNDLPIFFEILNIFFANIPYDIQIKQEKYYQTIFVLLFKLIGLQVEAETRTNRGRIDVVITLPERIFLFEFKLDGSAEEALAQIKEREYVARYRGSGKPITLIGASFNTQERGAAEWVTA